MDFWNKLANTWPARAAKDFYSAIQLPGDVYAGRVTPNDPDYYSRAFNLAGAVTGGSYLAPAEKNATGMGIRAYHGSPYDFEKFDLGKIGTGEGAQAYGRGLYFAENPKTANFYKTQGAYPESVEGEARRFIAKYGDDAQSGFQGEVQSAKQHYLEQGMKYDDSSDAKILDAIRNHRGQQPNPKTYEVDINAHPKQFLDFDNNPRIIDSAREAGGGRLSSSAASDYIRGLGYEGVKYLDNGSRQAGSGTSNYVVFNPSIVDILKKYGIAGGALTGAAVAGSQDQPEPAL